MMVLLGKFMWDFGIYVKICESPTKSGIVGRSVMRNPGWGKCPLSYPYLQTPIYNYKKLSRIVVPTVIKALVRVSPPIFTVKFENKPHLKKKILSFKYYSVQGVMAD